MNNLYIGIDNGTSGTIGLVKTEKYNECEFFETPSFSEQDYTKKKKNISRINSTELFNILKNTIEKNNYDKIFAILERPMINPTRFVASICAARAFESTLTIIEVLQIPRQFIDSKEWQKELLPQGLKGSDELKKASKDVGCRLFPQFKDLIVKHGDADGILIAEYAKRKNL
jgi:hypothetical protein